MADLLWVILLMNLLLRLTPPTLFNVSSSDRKFCIYRYIYRITGTSLLLSPSPTWVKLLMKMPSLSPSAPARFRFFFNHQTFSWIKLKFWSNFYKMVWFSLRCYNHYHQKTVRFISETGSQLSFLNFIFRCQFFYSLFVCKCGNW